MNTLASEITKSTLQKSQQIFIKWKITLFKVRNKLVETRKTADSFQYYSNFYCLFQQTTKYGVIKIHMQKANGCTNCLSTTKPKSQLKNLYILAILNFFLFYKSFYPTHEYLSFSFKIQNIFLCFFAIFPFFHYLVSAVETHHSSLLPYHGCRKKRDLLLRHFLFLIHSN